MATKQPAAYRPFRVAVYITFIAISSLGTLLFLASVVRNLRAPASEIASRAVVEAGRPVTPGAYRTCLRRYEGLRERLVERFFTVGEIASEQGSEGLQAWQRFAQEWEARLVDTGRACGQGSQLADDPRGQRLDALFDALVLLHRAYSTQATRLLLEHGQTIEAAAAAFREAEARL